jgi:hypothetical protein
LYRCHFLAHFSSVNTILEMTRVKINLRNGTTFKTYIFTNIDLALEFPLFRSLLENADGEELSLSFPDVTKEHLQLILEWIQYHKEHPQEKSNVLVPLLPNCNMKTNGFSNYDISFLTKLKKKKELFLVNLCNYLQHGELDGLLCELVNLLCAYIAYKMQYMSDEKRKHYL